ncbi:type II toxin-antitoxin system RelB/DinJ family antitoxin [Mobiluncus mulieris]|uniref:Addiction module antitoxin, RelB/DinJ family n=3 Tax=Mobiluncus mulieris TaxID=2052 RepID=E0QQA8_9ACTO|nr:hypothetical protein [Mobiluncus mulieris]EEJ54623.1 hypothetical protein HMPREF0577_0397 [Mobiluncus mulieris ATCC 35243]EEZ91799.1 hypothetical protein HMPREF0578_1041 [Mobiluncus mulieris 28-1]EFM46211.1 hypothetical protein HMPREF0580_1073 [Mobiluncus mulieris ATCC 35239]MCU9969250.1 type II toxin-antitoxin system RelB/DinJ family antitoxin [Mobiluncus mulieris]MCU9970529.1 type II toxin-antitoxin system RelB/DinJ family antitoxin [Mobiluncus mulieris]
MPLKQAVTRVEEQQYELFRRTTRELGTTPADALRMFIYAFNSHRGFPYEVRSLQPVDVEPFTNEADATRFATTLSLEAINAQR